MAERARGLCEYCRSPETIEGEYFGCFAHSVDHVIPKSRGGKSSFENLALCCQGCNSHKSSRIHAVDPASEERVPLFNPRLQEWSAHFAWSSDFSLIVGMTAIGRATVVVLDLNREGLIVLRRVLRRLGMHPL